MKKVYLLLSLFIIPVFFFSIGEVRADMKYNEIPETDFDYLTEDFYKFRDLVIKYSEENSKKYIIFRQSSTYPLAVYFFDEDDSGSNYYLNTINYGGFYAPIIKISSVQFFRPSDDFSSLNQLSNLTSETSLYYSTNTIYCNSYGCTFSIRTFLDTNLDYIYYKAINYDVTIIYNDLSYEISNNTRGVFPPTVYRVYTDIYGDEDSSDSKFTDEKEIMNNFYSTIFTKIGDLAISFANNYIFLLIFGIMILIFVIELIRRFLLWEKV